MSYKLYEGDCLQVMPLLEDQSIDMILCDLPYGTTACKWDTVIPFEPLWGEYERLIKDNGAIVLTASQPFTSQLVMSNPKMFKYTWTWYKHQVSGFLNSKRQPLRNCEDIAVFYKKQCTYNPIMTKGERKKKRLNGKSSNYNSFEAQPHYSDEYYPTTLLDIPLPRFKNGHPTQKPVALFEYLIKTYTNEGDLVLDNCAGSGTTGVAASNLNRNSILIEQEHEYCEIIRKRMKESEALKLNNANRRP